MILGKIRVLGHSMEPTIKYNQKVLASSLPYLFSQPKRNDIIAFKKDGKLFIKRITKISRSRYYVVGDNKHDSLDSRKFGTITKKQIIGKVLNV